MNNSGLKLILVILCVILVFVGLMMGTSFGPYRDLGPILMFIGGWSIFYIWLAHISRWF